MIESFLSALVYADLKKKPRREEEKEGEEQIILPYLFMFWNLAQSFWGTFQAWNPEISELAGVSRRWEGWRLCA